MAFVDLYKNVKALAKHNNMSVKEIERRCNMAYGSVRKWDKQSPSVDKVYNVCKVLNVSIEDFLTKDFSNTNVDFLITIPTPSVKITTRPKRGHKKIIAENNLPEQELEKALKLWKYYKSLNAVEMEWDNESSTVSSIL